MSSFPPVFLLFYGLLTPLVNSDYPFSLPAVGILPESFPTHMFCGMIGMSMLITGIHVTAVPISMDFHNQREIEDRLLAPVSSHTVAFAKMFVGVIESFIGGLIVLPISLIFMGSRISIQMTVVQDCIGDIIHFLLVQLEQGQNPVNIIICT